MYIKNTIIRRYCPVCGKKFKPTQGNQQICSSECRAIHLKIQKEESKIKRRLEKEKKQRQRNLKYTIEDICYIEGVFNKFIKEKKLPLSYQHYADIVLLLDQGVLEYNSNTKELKYKKELITELSN